MARQRMKLVANTKLLDLTDDAKTLTKAILGSGVLPADADRAALQSRRTNMQLAGQRMNAVVQLIKALGGGWTEPEWHETAGKGISPLPRDTRHQRELSELQPET